MRNPKARDGAGSVSRRDEGQVSILVVLAVGLFLLLFVGFGVDMTNLFFHRQTAQNAADAACVAAGEDLFVNRTKGPLGCHDFNLKTQYNCGGVGYTPSIGTRIDCNGKSAIGPVNSTSGSAVAPCVYAALNGYGSPKPYPLDPTSEGNNVSITFPPTVPGVITPSAVVAGPTPFVQVDVYDSVKVYFASLLSGNKTQQVHALAKCGLQNERQPVPIIVLDPTCPHAFEVSGNAGVTVFGGPPKSIQVNSSNSTCAAATTSGGGQCDGNGTINLSQGGPNLSGSDIGVFGAPNTSPPPGPPTNFMPGTTGHWVSPANPIPDPWAQLAPPTTAGLPVDPPTKSVGVPPFSAIPGHIMNEDGCPDLSNGCTEYSRGWYKTKTIDVKGFTALFQPGIYYITASQTFGNCATPGTGCLGKGGGGGSCAYGLLIEANGVVRPTDPLKAPGDGSGGTLFYFTSAGAGYESVYIDANAGNSGGRTILNALGSVANCPGFTCPTGTTCPPLPPGGFTGNVLTGPCTGIYSVQDYSTPPNNYHGMLLWDDRANADPHAQPKMSGGGGLLLAGNEYFHNCPNSLTTGCDPVNDYKAFMDLQGTPGSSTFVFGDITTDELILGGNANINMQLNPNLVLNILKVELLQ